MTAETWVHIASFVVQALPAKLEPIRAALLQYPELEIAAWDPAGKIVVVVETTDAAAFGRYADEIQRLPGVLVLGFVSHFSERLPLEEPVSS